MSRFFSHRFDALTPYTPGEQPQERRYNKLNTNESPFPPSPLAQKLAREEAGSLMLYSDPTVRRLVDAATDVFHVAPDEVLFSNGSDEVLNFAFMAFCDEDHPAVFADITYGFYSVFAALNRVPQQILPLREDLTIDLAPYRESHGTIFIANPNAPTGIALPKSAIEELVASDPDRVVVVDEAYIDFGGESCVDLIHSYPNLLVVQTFSKSRSLAGARLGMAFGCADLIADLNTIKYSTNPYNVNRMTMAAGIGALLDTGYFEENCRHIMENRVWTDQALRALGFEGPVSSANFIFLRHPKISGLELYQELKDRGILIRHFETSRLKDYNRITIGSMEQMRELVDTVTALLEEREALS